MQKRRKWPEWRDDKRGMKSTGRIAYFLGTFQIRTQQDESEPAAVMSEEASEGRRGPLSVWQSVRGLSSASLSSCLVYFGTNIAV